MEQPLAPSISADPLALPVISSLLGHGNIEMSLQCLASLHRCHRPACGFRLYDDGTLTDADRERLHAALDPVTFVRRSDIDAEIEERLARHPACRAYRREQVYAAKLLDVPLHSDGSFVFCDSDILFLRPFTGFERVRALCPRPVFMQDIWDSYAMRYWELLNPFRLRLVQRLNSGVMILDTAHLDLDFLEWFLNRPRPAHFSHFEQTFWSALIRRDGGKLLAPEQVGYPPSGGQSGAESAVAWHFVGPLRKGFDALAAAAAADEAAQRLPPVDLRVFRPRTLTFPRYLRSRWNKQRWFEESQRT